MTRSRLCTSAKLQLDFPGAAQVPTQASQVRPARKQDRYIKSARELPFTWLLFVISTPSRLLHSSVRRRSVTLFACVTVLSCQRPQRQTINLIHSLTHINLLVLDQLHFVGHASKECNGAVYEMVVSRKKLIISGPECVSDSQMCFGC